MRSRWILLAVAGAAGLIVFGALRTATADHRCHRHGGCWADRFGSWFADNYEETNRWPYPYVCEARASINAAMNAQIANGWMLSTTLHEFHFDPATNELNESGRNRLLWIIYQVPAQYRTIYVAAAPNPEVTTARLESVQLAGCALIGEESVPPVIAQPMRPIAVPGVYEDQVYRLYQEGVPSPRLPAGTSASFSSGEEGSE